MDPSRNKEWLDLQAKYLEALSSLGGAANEQSTADPAAGLQKMLASLWENNPFIPPGDPRSLFAAFHPRENSWQLLNRHFADMVRTVSAAGDSDADWQKMINEQFDRIREQLGAGGKTAPPWPDLQSGMEQFFSIPELQGSGAQAEQMRQGLKLWQAWQDCYSAYIDAMKKNDLASVDRLQEHLLALAEKGEPVSSLRELYDLWIEIQEETWNRFTATEEYSKLYGHLVNSLLQLRLHNQNFLSDMAGAWQQPEVKEKEKLEKEVEKLKREREKDRKRIKKLEKEIASLKPGKKRGKESSKGKKKNKKSRGKGAGKRAAGKGKAKK